MTGKSYIVLGAGQQGLAAAHELALNGTAVRVTLADVSLPAARAGILQVKKRLQAFASRAPRLSSIAVDARRESDLFKTIRGHSGVLSALPSALNVAAARASIAARAHYVDLGGNFETAKEILRLDRPAQKMGVALAPDCGFAPGLCNSLAAHGISRLERVSEVTIYSGVLPEHDIPPLGYQRAAHLADDLGAYFGTAYVLRNAQVAQIQGTTEYEKVPMDAPLGLLEAFATAGATSTAPWTFEGRVRSFSHKTLRYPGHLDKILMLKQLGMLDETPVPVEGRPMIPRSLFLALAETKLNHPDVRDLAVMKVIVRGEQLGQKMEVIYTLFEYPDPRTGLSARQKTAGIPAAIVLELLVTGAVRTQGVASMERAFSPLVYLDMVQRRGIRIQEAGPRPITPPATP